MTVCVDAVVLGIGDIDAVTVIPCARAVVLMCRTGVASTSCGGFVGGCDVSLAAVLMV